MSAIFRYLLAFRYISIVAVVASLVGAVVMFAIGAIRTINGLFVLLSDLGIVPPLTLPAHLGGDAAATVIIVQALDAFLFGLVLLIFAFGIYSLIIPFVTPEEFENIPAPFRIHHIDELKMSLAKVIIIILFVNVLEMVIIEGAESLSFAHLVIPIAILCLAGALYLMHITPKASDEHPVPK